MPAPATADVAKCNRWTRSCKVTSEANRPDGGPPTRGRPPQTRQRDHKDEENQKVRETIKKFSAALAVYDRQLASYNRCIGSFDPNLSKAGCGSAPTPPNAPRLPSDTFSGRGNQPPITADQSTAI